MLGLLAPVRRGLPGPRGRRVKLATWFPAALRGLTLTTVFGAADQLDAPPAWAPPGSTGYVLIPEPPRPPRG